MTTANTVTPERSTLMGYVSRHKFRVFLIVSIALHLVVGLGWGVPAYVQEKRAQEAARLQAEFKKKQEAAALEEIDKAKKSALDAAKADVLKQLRKTYDTLVRDLAAERQQQLWTAVAKRLEPPVEALATALGDPSATESDLRNLQADLNRRLVQFVNEELAANLGTWMQADFLARVQTLVIPQLQTHYRAALDRQLASALRESGNKFADAKRKDAKGPAADDAFRLGRAGVAHARDPMLVTASEKSFNNAINTFAARHISDTLANQLSAALEARDIKDPALIEDTKKKVIELLATKLPAGADFGHAGTDRLKEAFGLDTADEASVAPVAEAFTTSVAPLIDERTKQIAQETAPIDGILAKAAPKPGESKDDEVAYRLETMAQNAAEGRTISGLDGLVDGGFMDIRQEALARNAAIENMGTDVPATQPGDEAATSQPAIDPMVEAAMADVWKALKIEFDDIVKDKRTPAQAAKLWEFVKERAGPAVQTFTEALLNPAMGKQELEDKRIELGKAFATLVRQAMDESILTDMGNELVQQLQGEAGDKIADSYRDALKDNVGKPLTRAIADGISKEKRDATAALAEIRAALEATATTGNNVGKAIDQSRDRVNAARPNRAKDGDKPDAPANKAAIGEVAAVTAQSKTIDDAGAKVAKLSAAITWKLPASKEKVEAVPAATTAVSKAITQSIEATKTNASDFVQSLQPVRTSLQALQVAVKDAIAALGAEAEEAARQYALAAKNLTSTTQPAATAQTPAASATTQPVANANTSASTQPVASANTAASTQPVASANASTQPVASANASTQPVAQAGNTTPPVASANASTQPIAQAGNTTPPSSASTGATKPPAPANTGATTPPSAQANSGKPAAGATTGAAQPPASVAATVDKEFDQQFREHAVDPLVDVVMDKFKDRVKQAGVAVPDDTGGLRDRVKEVLIAKATGNSPAAAEAPAADAGKPEAAASNTKGDTKGEAGSAKAGDAGKTGSAKAGDATAGTSAAGKSGDKSTDAKSGTAKPENKNAGAAGAAAMAGVDAKALKDADKAAGTPSDATVAKVKATADAVVKAGVAEATGNVRGGKEINGTAKGLEPDAGGKDLRREVGQIEEAAAVGHTEVLDGSKPGTSVGELRERWIGSGEGDAGAMADAGGAAGEGAAGEAGKGEGVGAGAGAGVGAGAAGGAQGAGKAGAMAGAGAGAGAGSGNGAGAGAGRPGGGRQGVASGDGIVRSPWLVGGSGQRIDKEKYEKTAGIIAGREQTTGGGWNRAGAQGEGTRDTDEKTRKAAAIVSPTQPPQMQIKNGDPYTPTFKSIRFAAIPFLNRPFKMDGNWDKWKDIPSMDMPIERYNTDPDHKLANTIPLKVAWDGAGLYFMIDVTDTDGKIDLPPNGASFWAGDAPEVWIDTLNTKERQRYSGSGQQFWCWPFGSQANKDAPGGESVAMRSIGFKPYDFTNAQMQKAAVKTEKGYKVEFNIPVERLRNADFVAGKIIGMNVTVETVPSISKPLVHYFWSSSKATGTYGRPDTWGDILLAGSDGKLEIPKKLTGEGSDAEAAETLTSFVIGQPLRLRVTDRDMNLNPRGRDKLSVTVRNPRGENEVAILEETGPSTGIFEGALRTQLAFGERIPATVTLHDGESVTVTYVDQARANGARNAELTYTVKSGSPVTSGGTKAAAK